ncbi:MAG: hypothetical protein WBH19_08705 [Candidatus Nanopelagicales bacterium]|tara:strand:- start:433 stop:621 length:189 start_codon:yes stop_codon:yes gene_type:complete
MPNLIAIANFIGTNLLGNTPPYGGEDLVTEINTPGGGQGSLQMVSEDGTGLPNSDLITEQAP